MSDFVLNAVLLLLSVGLPILIAGRLIDSGILAAIFCFLIALFVVQLRRHRHLASLVGLSVQPFLALQKCKGLVLDAQAELQKDYHLLQLCLVELFSAPKGHLVKRTYREQIALAARGKSAQSNRTVAAG